MLFAAPTTMFVYLRRYNGQVLGSEYGSGNETDPIWLDNVECTGSETSISQCGHSGWGVHNNTHADDVSISCYFDYAIKYAGSNCFHRYRCKYIVDCSKAAVTVIDSRTVSLFNSRNFFSQYYQSYILFTSSPSPTPI